MKKKLLLLSSLFFLLDYLNATPNNFDIYGVNPELQKKIFSLCKQEIYEYDQLSRQIKLSLEIDSRVIKRHEIEMSIIKKVHTLGDFNIVSISTINYPQNQKLYSTLDIVQKHDFFRLPKSPIKNKKILKRSKALKKLFQLWNNYTARTIKLMNENKYDAKNRTCSVVHCTWGFDKNEVKNDVPLLKYGASKYKNQLVDIIKYSNNEQERGQAIFILANSNNYHELAKLMMSLIDDSNDYVRNNALRVLGAIVSKYDIYNLNIHNILVALNYPYVTDRNKAAYILWQIVQKNKLTHAVVIQKAGNTLINLLKLKQPNNHDYAYLILKKISGQKYTENNYQKWQQWLDSHKIID